MQQGAGAAASRTPLPRRYFEELAVRAQPQELSSREGLAGPPSPCFLPRKPKPSHPAPPLCRRHAKHLGQALLHLALEDMLAPFKKASREWVACLPGPRGQLLLLLLLPLPCAQHPVHVPPLGTSVLHRGMWLALPGGAELVQLYPALSMIVADTQVRAWQSSPGQRCAAHQCALFGRGAALDTCPAPGRPQEMAALTLTTGSNKSPYPDISTLVPKERLAKPGEGLKAGRSVPRRTEGWLERVREGREGVQTGEEVG